MKLAIRSTFAVLALCFAGCATTSAQSVTFHGIASARLPASASTLPSARSASVVAAFEAPHMAEPMNTGHVERGIPMPEPARESHYAVPTPQVPIPYTPERGMSFVAPRGGNAARWY